MLTVRGEDTDVARGLELGADDYITKPFSLRELQSLVRARLRYREQTAADSISHFTFDDIAINFDKNKATLNKKPLDLTSREFEILQLLIRYRGQVVTRERILEKIWGFNACATPRTVDNHILRIRKKIEPVPSNPKYLLSAYGGGYKFVG
jgi:two-component system alkaline phosphatase synthesis response regulator PhoP